MQVMELRHVILYAGSFDPPHDGHRRVLQEALRQTGAAVAVVCAHDKDNAYKPNRTATPIRLAMLKEAFGDMPNVKIAADSQKEMHLHGAYVSFLIGVDAWEHFSQKAMKYDKLLVASRVGSLMPRLEYHCSKPVQTITCYYPPYSSTKIRTFLQKHSAVYDSPNIACLPMPPEVLAIITKEGLYAHPDVLRARIYKQFLTSACNTTIVQLRPGLSGDLIFRLETSPPVFVKAFTEMHRKDEEQQSFRLLQSLALKQITTPKILWEKTDGQHSFLAYEYVEAKDLISSINEIDSENLGKALFELHSYAQKTMSEPLFTKWCDTLFQKATSFIDKKPEDEREAHVKKLTSTLNAYKANPGKWCYVHGDANPGNFFVSDKVTFVDIGSMSRYLGPDMSPQGYAGYEYHQMLSSFHRYVDSIQVQKAISAFCTGYSDNNSLITPEAHTFYSFYWSLISFPFVAATSRFDGMLNTAYGVPAAAQIVSKVKSSWSINT